MMENTSESAEVSVREIAMEIGALVTDRNKEYGDSFLKVAEVLDILYPNGIERSHYEHATLLVRVLDKACRLANGHLDDSWRDIAGYGLLGEYITRKAAGG